MFLDVALQVMFTAFKIVPYFTTFECGCAGAVYFVQHNVPLNLHIPLRLLDAEERWVRVRVRVRVNPTLTTPRMQRRLARQELNGLLNGLWHQSY